MIRHACLRAAPPILPLPVAMIESSFRTLLVSAIGATTLREPGLLAASEAAITLPAITAGTKKKDGVTLVAKANPLPENYFANRLARPHAGAGHRQRLRGRLEPA